LRAGEVVQGQDRSGCVAVQ